jgi:hypothetical protein
MKWKNVGRRMTLRSTLVFGVEESSTVDVVRVGGGLGEDMVVGDH